MESETTPSADSGHPVDDSAFVGPPSDSEDIFLPANESFLSVNTASIDTGHDKVLPEPPHDAEEPPESPNESLALSLTDSRTSTLKYDQEPFTQYQIRVKSLCHMLWPAEPGIATSERGGGATKSRILDAVRVKKLRRFLSPSSEKEFVIERLDGGTYNRVTGITVKDTGVNSKHLVLRAPRPEMAAYGHIAQEVAILRYVRQNTTLPVADVIRFDVTANNPLESGYVIQSRLPGVSLRVMWDDLTHDHRCKIAEEIGKIVLALQAVKNPTPGIIEASGDDKAQRYIVRPFDVKSAYDGDWKSKVPVFNPDEAIATSQQDPLNWFGTQFGRWLAFELLQSPDQILYWDCQLRFVKAAREMEEIGFLGDGQNCLHHFDLAARNFMVQIQSDGSPAISGIVDWDSAAFVPTFVSCAPLSWLWTSKTHYDSNGNEVDGTPSTPEQEEIKEVFEDAVGFDWEWFAYQPGFRLARELFHFARHGNQDQMATKRAEKFLKEWDSLYESKKNPKNDDGDRKDLTNSDNLEEDDVLDEPSMDIASE